MSYQQGYAPPGPPQQAYYPPQPGYEQPGYNQGYAPQYPPGPQYQQPQYPPPQQQDKSSDKGCLAIWLSSAVASYVKRAANAALNAVTYAVSLPHL
ncbi:hypothetical protein N7535_008291 [Penicillium sp. DV-2018c]|nr:hypothetical protein N7461_004330 [Penicillium sp. DV-2018c]KAJ5566653.1 hypothetical protein N7535_008291 [Penicillium sp. DV-2018c]